MLAAIAAPLAAQAQQPGKAAAGEGGSWAFSAPAPSAAPPVADSWVRGPVDAFIWHRLQERALRPSPAASKERLARRVSLDLTGLPPTREQMLTFLADPSPDSYRRFVDSLLASPHYGERWAQKWLDVVRYADTNGFELDGYREHGWRYRDYVVRSFNQDKPFDRFVQEQVAGDELFPGDEEALVATGFHAAGPRHMVGGNQDKEEARQEVLTEMVLGVGQALLGLTVQCARCHDHKFDPITQQDYYRLAAFFAGSELEDAVLATEAERVRSERQRAAHEERLAPIKKRLDELEAPYREQVRERKHQELSPEHAAALATPEDRRSEEQERLAKEANAQIKPAWYEVLPLIPPAVKEIRAGLRRQMHALDLVKPAPPRTALAVKNTAGAEPTHVLLGGDHRRKGDNVTADFLSSIGSLGFTVPDGAAGRRAALASWLTDSDHPLVARVMVNRVWEFRMGRGLVRDPNNFGLLGGMPTHPGLLDALAGRFVEEGWSVKAIDRLIVLSSAYRQAADIDPQKAEADPSNELYWRASRRRLSAESIRDSALAASGRLNRALAGRPVRIPIEPEVYDLIFTEAEPDNLWPVTPDWREHDRRSLYLLNKRTVRLPFLANFDQPDTMTSCSVRPTSTHALQSLSLLNSDFMQVQARSLAEKLRRECGAGDSLCQIRSLFQITLARDPTPAERNLAGHFLASPAGADRLHDLSLAILNRNEFVYRP